MATTTRKNASVKALQGFLATNKKKSEVSLLEWLISCNTNNKRGHIFDQTELMNLYGRRVDYDEDECGATKVCHLKSHLGFKFENIVIKRAKSNAHAGLGNQLIDEINCWVEMAETEDADLLCPIMRYFTSKSDKVSKNSRTMFNNVIIIAQKAVYVSSASRACRKAEELNIKYGFMGEDADTRYQKLKELSNKKSWWDAMDNGGNSGVIFDYAQGCYKAVFIDYAL